MSKINTTADYVSWRNKTLLASESLNHQSKECNDVEPSKSITLHSTEGVFSFQCSCGEIHQFQHIENKEGLTLYLSLSQNKDA